MILATTAIIDALASGAIFCEPRPQRIEGAHIDVHLGKWFWLKKEPRSSFFDGGEPILLAEAEPRTSFYLGTTEWIGNEKCVVIPAHSFALCHTEEYIGTTVPDLVPMLHTRSTLARWGLSIHEGAGMGDCFFAGRFTLEIWNHHTEAVAIPVGARVGGVAFHRCEGEAVRYEGRYNVGPDAWTPDAMLPRVNNF